MDGFTDMGFYRKCGRRDFTAGIFHAAFCKKFGFSLPAWRPYVNGSIIGTLRL